MDQIVVWITEREKKVFDFIFSVKKLISYGCEQILGTSNKTNDDGGGGGGVVWINTHRGPFKHINIGQYCVFVLWNNRSELMITCKWPFVRCATQRMSNPKKIAVSSKAIELLQRVCVCVLEHTWNWNRMLLCRSHLSNTLFSHLSIFASFVQYVRW